MRERHGGSPCGEALRRSRRETVNDPEAPPAEAQPDQSQRESEKPKRRRRAKEMPPELDAVPAPVRHCFADMSAEDFAALAEAPLVGEDAAEGWVSAPGA